jgi:hypothetical protein
MAQTQTSPFDTFEDQVPKAPKLDTVSDGVGGITSITGKTPRVASEAPFKLTTEEFLKRGERPYPIGEGDFMKAVQPTMDELTRKSEEYAQFQGLEKEQEARSLAEATQMKADAKRREKLAIEESPEFAMSRKLQDEMMNSEFVPTKDTAKDIAGLFSLVGLIGWAIGGSGKDNAIQAMNAMDGMLSGYQKGRVDLFKREKDTFETNFKALKTKTEVITNRLKQIAELAAVDSQAAYLEADAFLANQRADFVKQYLDKYKLPATIKLLENTLKLTTEAEKNRQNLITKAQDRSDRYYITAFTTQQKDAASNSKGLKPSAADVKIYRDKNVLLYMYNDLKNKLRDPELKKFINDNRLNSFLSEDAGKIIAQLTTPDLPPKLRNFLIQASTVRNAYFLDQSGKAVTGGEAMRNYGVVPARGDTFEVTQDKLNQMVSKLEKDVLGYQALYANLPDIYSSIASGQPYGPATQKGENVYQRPGMGAYSVGQIIEKGGKRYQVIGGDMNDPDVEEIE